MEGADAGINAEHLVAMALQASREGFGACAVYEAGCWTWGVAEHSGQHGLTAAWIGCAF